LFEKILPGLYRIEVPLPGSPLKATNSYVIKDSGRSLVIDTGWNREDCMAALSSGLKECGVDLEAADFLITHLHADHSGLVAALATEESRVYLSQRDAEIIGSATVAGFWERETDFARMHGFSDEELEKAMGSHPGRRYSAKTGISFSTLKDGDTIALGDYSFECIETPGHTEGHICLYDRGKRIFISGDHVLGDITPNISLWSDERDPLREYLASLDKVYDLDVALVLPGHRGIFSDHRGRIDELRQHHRARLDEVVSILRKGRQNVFRVASQMSWDIDCRSWDSFPPAQKWFAFGEAAAHLKYLEREGRVAREMAGREPVFFIRGGG
jgi:glyoxylase-like metal-dependent hydrolase (beta-lactamase superfamily II)